MLLAKWPKPLPAPTAHRSSDDAVVPACRGDSHNDPSPEVRPVLRQTRLSAAGAHAADLPPSVIGLAALAQLNEENRRSFAS